MYRPGCKSMGYRQMDDGDVRLYAFAWHSGVIIAIIVCSSHKDQYEAANAELNDWTARMPA